MHRRKRVARLVLAAACLAAPTVSIAAASPASPPASGVTVTAASPTALDVHWTAPEDASRWWVIVSSADDRSVGQRTACGACRDVRVDHLAPASNYFVRVVAVDSSGAFGTFAIAVGSTPPEPECAAVASPVACVLVDATAGGDQADGVGLGALHGVTAETSAERVRSIEPTAWRISALDHERFVLARSYGGSVTVLLSDPWMNATNSMAPWSSWEFYEWWLGAVVDWHILVGAVPEYWEVQNEPTYQSYQGAAAATPELVFEQHRRAAAVIHSRLPDAAVIGPSPGYVRFGSGLVDIDDFVQRAAATGTEFGGLSWHEIGASCLGYCDGSPRAVLQHADDVRAAVAAAPNLGPIELHVNEWGAPWNYSQPGAAVGYLSSLAYARVDVANPACWETTVAGAVPVSTCFSRPGMLDGLLLLDGSTPTDAWFAHRAFAQMTGDGVALVDSTVSDPQASVVATVDGGGTIRVLLGRHTGCDVSVDEHCPGLVYAPPRLVRPVVATGSAAPAFAVTVERIPSVAGALIGPTRIDDRTVAAADGRVDLGSYEVADGEALVITLVPDASPLPTTSTTTTIAPTTTTTTTTTTTMTTTSTTTTTAPATARPGPGPRPRAAR